MTHQQKLFNSCLEELEAGRSVVRAVILRTWGSTPRETGADMVMTADGGLLGTVGGGCGEAEVYELAQEMLGAHASQGTILHIDLTENPDDGGGKVCGGRFDVLLHKLTPEKDLESLRRAVDVLGEGGGSAWQTDLGTAKTGFWKQGLHQVELTPALKVGPTNLSEVGWTENIFTEPLGLSRTLVIVGAGHIARPLCDMAATTGYQVVIIDDRGEYADAKFFPRAARVLHGEYEAMLLPEVKNPDLVSVVLVTRGHRHDQECLRLIADRKLEYLGMIGSQRRIDAVFADLVAEGVRADDLRRVSAPIGLEIGAQTPAEIAVCILAEMIMKRRLPSEGREAQTRQRHIRSLSAK